MTLMSAGAAAQSNVVHGPPPPPPPRCPTGVESEPGEAWGHAAAVSPSKHHLSTT